MRRAFFQCISSPKDRGFRLERVRYSSLGAPAVGYAGTARTSVTAYAPELH